MSPNAGPTTPAPEAAGYAVNSATAGAAGAGLAANEDGYGAPRLCRGQSVWPATLRTAPP